MATRQTIAIFPLQLIAFPGERVSLHIFEPRYRKLIEDCRESGVPFGIIPVLDQQALPLGTLMRLERIAKAYPDGRYDVVVRGQLPFAVTEFVPMPETQEAHRAEIEAIVQDPTYEPSTRTEVLGLYRRYQALSGTVHDPAPDALSLSFAIAHTAGLSDGEKIELLRTPGEQRRLELLREHFTAVVPRLEAVEKARKRAQQNGDYRLFPELRLNLGLG
ncbi:MAG: LON peptidase substrate-binding domain-containing protein [Bacteroidia bacterium]|nr:LON peptidase substrate-binding domain-containing protein [Bacteroidia bacterium]